MDFREATPVAFINVTERERALTFYRNILGFELSSADSYGDFIAMGQALIRMTVMPGYQPPPYPVCGWEVADIGAAVALLAGRGVTMTIYEGLGQDEQGIWTSPENGSKVAFFSDSEGNVLSLSQRWTRP
jgi:catechol 2,3-dioxygenase-like lactoylglutathione lyase family enzyme